MKIGDIVRSTDPHGNPLCSGCEIFGGAVVISTDPLILVSEHADMRWSKRTAESLVVVGETTPEHLAKCMRRLEK